VAEAAVVGMADPLRGEAVRAFVVLREGAAADADDLKQFAKQHLAHFKVPHRIDLVDQLPKNRTGKVDKEALKAG
jgi:acyl-coenzyme A synthetase/AMP-(fatty) acid ligase